MTEPEHEHDDDEATERLATDDEADEAAEADETTEAPETTADEPAEASSQDAALQELWGKRWKTHERLSNAYFKKIEDLWAEDATKLTRWMIGPNSPYGYISELDVGRLPDDFKQGLETVLGTVREQDYADDPNAIQCSACRGKGKTKLPSTSPGHESRVCPQCNGAGWLETASSAAPAGTNGVAPPAISLAVAPDIQHGETDEWGEPRILPDGRANPNYGKLPQHKVTVEPFGITRLLTQQG